ncbi:MAG: glycine cleavage system protein H [Planctomycetaceae bacterium]|mgnify:CR=1 FL=1|nr:glycine cleavage system protein H [Planctomycetaceae bacterium]MCH2595811.1 glycine cleavage system protein GcvH [Pirellulales bacterium]HCK41121.1 glycine cleavage system protein GcvH [Planctomycetaceae bacterium]
MKPQELLYAKTHEWIAIAEEDGTRVATLGISAFAVEALTDLVYIDLPEVGKQVEAEQAFCEVESVKAVSDIYSPIDGEVIAVNDDLPNSLETLGQDPYGSGWIAKIKINNDSGLNKLLDYSTYEKQCDEEVH